MPRLGAAIYEALLVAALVFVTGFLMLPLVSPGQAAPGAPLTVPPLPSRVALFCALFAMLALYFVWGWTGGRRTLPMKTWHLRIVATRGGNPTRKLALLRYVAAWIGTRSPRWLRGAAQRAMPDWPRGCSSSISRGRRSIPIVNSCTTGSSGQRVVTEG